MFKAYDIRGTVGVDFHKEDFRFLGRALAVWLLRQNITSIHIGTDSRDTSTELSELLISGMGSVCAADNLAMNKSADDQAAKIFCEAVHTFSDIRSSTGHGIESDAQERHSEQSIEIYLQPEITTPMCVWSMRYLNLQACAMITASHNPWEDNGLKIYLNKGHVHPVCGEELLEIKQIIETLMHEPIKIVEPTYKTVDCLEDYIQSLPKTSQNILWNACNGAGARILKRLGPVMQCQALQAPDPALVTDWPDHQLILSIDGDGDRLSVRLDGENLTAEEIATALQASSIVHDVHLSTAAKNTFTNRSIGQKAPVEQTYDLAAEDLYAVTTKTSCLSAGSEPITNEGLALFQAKVGHSYMQQKMQETQADMGFEASGHFFFKELGTMDDGIYAGLKFAQNLSRVRRVKGFISTVHRIFCSDPVAVIRKAEEIAATSEVSVDKTDGIKLIYSFGWLLLRRSNTQKCISAMFEGADRASYEKLQKLLGELTE